MKKGNRGMERLVVIIFMIYHAFMIMGSIGLEMPAWTAPLITVIAASSLVIFVGKIRGYEFRTRVYVTGIMANLFIFSLFSDLVQITLVPFIFVVITIGLLGIKELLIYPAISIMIIIFVQYFVLDKLRIYSIREVYTVINPIANVFTAILVIAIWDYSREKREAQVQNIISNLKKAERSKDDFLANVSHEVRTPINSIKGISEIILREDIDPELRHNIEKIQLSGNNLLRIVDDLLDFTEVLSGNFYINDGNYCIDSLLNDVVNISNVMKGDKSIELIFNCNPSFPRELVGDVQKIKRIIVNLISNAIKFTNEGGVIVDFDYRYEEYGINLCISFRDTGIGIDRKSMETIFTSFSQVDSKRNRVEGGVGMGLALSKAIVEKMGGFINVRSELGIGSEFRVVIPQKISSDKKLITGNHIKKGHVLVYIDMEQFHMVEIRDEYTKLIHNLSHGLDMPVYLCRNLAEFKRREGLNHYDYFFISWVEYCYDKDYFNKLADSKNLSVFVEFNQTANVDNQRINVIYKPLNILNVISVFGDRIITKSRDYIAPEARVMIVDDNEVNLRVASGLLKKYQCKVTTVTNGAEALELLDSKLYDLVFMDHMMPEMDGVETLHHIREKRDAYFRELPVIALTANAIPGAREMFLKEGFQEFVAKPIDSLHLGKVLMYFLPAEKIIAVENTVVNDLEEEKTESVVKAEGKTEEGKATEGENKGPDIDMKKASAYCGSREDALDILKIHYEDGEENLDKIQSCYDSKDWKNYVILVHGLKSSMRSVGIERLADMSYGLEMAGKKTDIEYIDANHDAMMSEYRRILSVIGDMLGIGTDSGREKTILPEISLGRLGDYLAEFEDAVYTFEKEEISGVLKEVFRYSFRGVNLADSLDQVNSAVSESDFMSALTYFSNFLTNAAKEESFNG